MSEALIREFYDAFAQRDADRMAACYHPEVTFSDPVFGELHGDQARGMWRMLCERGKDLQVEASDIWAEGDRGGAHWDARYTFAQSGRPVLNRIDATFRFRDGLIVRHDDTFDMRKWAGQAMGLPGKLLGGTPFFRKKVSDRARKSLEVYLSKRSGDA